MPASPLLLLLALALGAGAVAVLRHGWSLPKRSIGWNGTGWALLTAAAAAGWASDGAWGVAMATIAAMAAACAVLAVAGWRSPPGKARGSNRRVGMLPEAGEPRRVGRRIVTFLLVIVGGLFVSIGFALTIRGLGGALGWNEANTLVIALYTVPLGWGVLVTVLLMQERRRNQIGTLVLCSLPPLIPLLVTGGF